MFLPKDVNELYTQFANKVHTADILDIMPTVTHLPCRPAPRPGGANSRRARGISEAILWTNSGGRCQGIAVFRLGRKRLMRLGAFCQQ